MLPNVVDQCDDMPLGFSVDGEGRPRVDPNLDCKLDLRNYAIFQNSMVGP